MIINYKKYMKNIHIVKNQEELDAVYAIREKVFIGGQNVPPELEHDGLDECSEHAVLFFENIPAGCARIRIVDDQIRLERIAVLEQFRGKGLGADMMRFLVNYAKDKKAAAVTMHAQYYLLDFYKNFGFEPSGAPFMEADIKHIEMILKLRSKRN